MLDSPLRQEVRELAATQGVTEHHAVRELLLLVDDELLKHHKANDHWEFIPVLKRKVDLQSVAQQIGAPLLAPPITTLSALSALRR